MTNDSVHPALRRIDSLEEVDALPDGTLIWYWITWDGTRIHALMRKRDGDWFSATNPDDDFHHYRPVVPAFVMPTIADYRNSVSRPGGDAA